MEWLVITQIMISVLYAAYLVYFYALPEVHIGVKLTVYLTWLLSFGIVVLLPYDIYYANPDSPDYFMQTTWKVMYSLIMVLTWVLLPIAQEYESAGEFTRCNKLKRAIINNLILYGVIVLVGVVFLVLMLLGKFDLQSLSPLLMAASTAFGMLLVVIFLSYGLVAVPKSLWREQKYDIHLKKNQFHASVLVKKKESILHELELKVKEAYWHIKNNGETPETNYVINLVPQKFRERWSRNVPNLGQVDVVKIHKEIKELTLELGRIDSRWEELLFDTFRVEDILTDMNSKKYRIESTLFPHFKVDFLNTLIWFWYCRLKMYLTPLLAIFFSLFAFAIIIAEFSAFFEVLASFSPFAILATIQNFIAVDLLLLVVMSYIAFCVFYALFKLKFASFYGLYWNQQTDSASLIFFAINCSRVSTPLCYNFLQMIHKKNTSFEVVMKITNVGEVFGKTFNVVFPVLLILLIVFNALDVYSLLARRLGMQKFQFEANFEHQNIEDGKRILRKARTDLETKVLNSNGKNLEDFRSYKGELELETASETSKENSSSEEQLNVKPKYFNQFSNVGDVMKIMDM